VRAPGRRLHGALTRPRPPARRRTPGRELQQQLGQFEQVQDAQSVDQTQAERQYCQRAVPQQRKCVPLRYSQALPGRSAQAPHVQDAVQVCCEQGSQDPARVVPGVQVPAGQLVHEPQAQVAPHVRDCVPPQVQERDSVAPGVHTPVAQPLQAPHVQSL
jgi:hypothetical protein